jgi:hypothetical protein
MNRKSPSVPKWKELLGFDKRSLSLFRVSLALIVIYDVVNRSNWIREHYSGMILHFLTHSTNKKHTTQQLQKLQQTTIEFNSEYTKKCNTASFIIEKNKRILIEYMKYNNNNNNNNNNPSHAAHLTRNYYLFR